MQKAFSWIVVSCYSSVFFRRHLYWPSRRIQKNGQDLSSLPSLLQTVVPDPGRNRRRQKKVEQIEAQQKKEAIRIQSLGDLQEEKSPIRPSYQFNLESLFRKK
jgi:hypothetical protein